MNAFTVTAPVQGYNGESCGVVFKDGVGHVTDAEKSGRAAIEYFRRRGYVLVREGEEEATEPASPDSLFDPSEHDVSEVLAHLDSLGADDSDAVAEFDRVIEAEKAGKNRKTIVARGEKQEGQQ